ncbi:MAG: NAD-dependent epimerase/dehydratase family protein [Elusimicrobia bacterium]|nr:NAD-dependent epimerase/dehydratase family protein [Elusimicrobiota bacterium]
MLYKNKTVLVTGGTGFVGLNIVQELLKTQAKVRVPIHKRPMVIKNKRIETLDADLTRQEDCLRALGGVDYVFHAAGPVGSALVTSSKPAQALEGITTNLTLTAQILQAAWACGVKRTLIFSSSAGYPAADHPVKEEEMWSGPPHPAYFGYGWMRRYLERLGEYVASRSTMKISIVRPTAVYGRHDNFDLKTGHVIPSLVRRALARQNPFIVWGNGEEARDFLHISDLARGCLLMLEKYPVCDPVNIAYGRSFSIKEITRIILKAAGHGDAEVQFDASQPTTIPYRATDITKAKKLLGFEPKITLEDGLIDTIEWYKSQKASIPPT